MTETSQSFREVIGGCPLDCPDACSWVVTVDGDGRAVSLRGNPHHPITRGGLCPKVNPWLEHAADPTRLLHPLRRTGAKGSGRFERISWDEAIATIADRFTRIVGEHGAEAIWPFDGTGNLGALQGSGSVPRLWQVLGTSVHHLSICTIAGFLGLQYAMGDTTTLDPEDLVHARTILLWGTNTLTTNRHLWPFVDEARARGAHVVAIDPVRHRTADRCDEHVAIRPGTDAAFALGLCHVIARTRIDQGFLDHYCTGWDEFEPSLAEWTPERVAAECGVDAEIVVALGERIATQGPVAIRLGQGMQRHRFGGQAARVVASIPALTGDHARLGGGLLYSVSVEALDGEALSRFDLGPSDRRLLVMTMLAHHLRTADPPVKALFVTNANPVVSNPASADVRAELARDDLFTVVFDAYLTDTARYADLVLPSTLQTEHLDVVASYGHLYVQWNEPAVAPPGECLSRTEMLRRLAAALGLDEPALYDTDLDLARAALSGERWRAAGVGVDELRAAGWMRIPGTEAYGVGTGSGKPFGTASGRFELASETAQRDGHGRLPEHRPAREAVAGPPGTFALIAAASAAHVNSTFAGVEHAAARRAEPTVTICTADAAALGLVDGQRVEVLNDRGGFVARLHVDDAPRAGVAVSTKGAWTTAFADGRTINDTVAERASDMGAGAVFHDNRVIIRPI
ncbi:MAG: molybdopterin-dependent oxidoreductase [Acidimicrobiales bacterium]